MKKVFKSMFILLVCIIMVLPIQVNAVSEKLSEDTFHFLTDKEWYSYGEKVDISAKTDGNITFGYEFYVDGELVSREPNCGSNSFRYSPSSLSVGEHIFKAIVFDKTGTRFEETITINIGNQPRNNLSNWCLHESFTDVYTGQSKYAPIDGDDESHSAVNIYYKTCNRCQYVIHTFESRGENQKHKFSGNVCEICGYVLKSNSNSTDIPPVSQSVAKLATPVIKNPPIGSDTFYKSVNADKTIYWNTVPGADYYAVIRWPSEEEIALGRLEPIYLADRTTKHSITITGLGKGTYAYSIYACSNDGAQSEPYSFNINYSPVASVVKEVLHTDIKAYIDDRPIRSFNIDGYTAIVAEDLSLYGFRVEYNDSNRSLYIDEGNKKYTSVYEHTQETGVIGSKAMDVYSTDIKTYAFGYEITGYNVNGYTIVFLDDLKAFGTTYWNPEKRAIGFYRY